MRFSKVITVCAAVLLICKGAAAQTSGYSDKDYERKPLWIQMMDDTTVNFLEIEKAYNLYWQHHQMPEGEHEAMQETANKKITKRRIRRVQAEIDMSMAVKRYIFWRRQMLPYVQADGRILSADERLKIWRSNQ